MGTVLRFRERRNHAASRAAMRVSTSAVTPERRASELDVTEDHQSAGIESLCHHLDTDAGLAPTSAAIASRVGQSSIIARKDCNGTMNAPHDSRGRSIVQDVLSSNPDRPVKSTAPPPKEGLATSGHNVLLFPPMGTEDSDIEFKAAFLARVKETRE